LRKGVEKLRKEVARVKEGRELLSEKSSSLVESYRRWCFDESRREINADYPLLRKVRSHSALLFLEYQNQLRSKDEVRQLFSVLLKRNMHEMLTSKEQDIFHDYYNYCSGLMQYVAPNGKTLDVVRNSEQEMSYRSLYDKYTTPVSETRNKLRRHIRIQGREKLGALILDRAKALWFEKEINGLFVVTAIEFGGWNMVRYTHAIYSESGADRANMLLGGISVLGWLGISDTTWDWITPDEIHVVAEYICELCAYFIAQVSSIHGHI
jgi:hypothetical protein